MEEAGDQPSSESPASDDDVPNRQRGRRRRLTAAAAATAPLTSPTASATSTSTATSSRASSKGTKRRRASATAPIPGNQSAATLYGLLMEQYAKDANAVQNDRIALWLPPADNNRRAALASTDERVAARTGENPILAEMRRSAVERVNTTHDEFAFLLDHLHSEVAQLHATIESDQSTIRRNEKAIAEQAARLEQLKESITSAHSQLGQAAAAGSEAARRSIAAASAAASAAEAAEQREQRRQLNTQRDAVAASVRAAQRAREDAETEREHRERDAAAE
jgi:hypothetical protein